ncbi:MAG: sulfatase [Desulfobacterales bacterium]|nr:sulfatase [Desulfobacterales bacterium]
MRTVFVLFDSLIRRGLECYGGNLITPNFQRFADKSVTFTNHYVGSLPCMPARRELHTGRHNFLHRSWGPIEPFDISGFELMKRNGIYAHLISDHYHYWEDGGLTYANRYNSWEFMRGQEWDPWAAVVNPPLPEYKEKYHPLQYAEPGKKGGRGQGIINHEAMPDEEDHPMVQCFNAAFKFLDTNREADNWVLNLECFDPHEPFFVPERFRELYPTDYKGPILTWPIYKRVQESEEEIDELRANYAALMTMCDEYLGLLLDYFDKHELWKNTALIVTTDHGFLLGEHEWWAKSRMPFYNEISHIPLLFYHPDHSDQAGTKRHSITQNIDIMPTLLSMYDLEIPKIVEGHSLVSMMEHDAPVRKAAIYGQFGAATNVTDGRYTYFRYPEDFRNQELYQYTLMPTHQNSLFTKDDFNNASYEYSFKFLQGFPAMKLPVGPPESRGQGALIEDTQTVLYDLQTDPDQNNPIENPEVKLRLIREMTNIMKRNEAPPEAYRRLNLEVPA